jgi:putative nucleotidyltransferase with HDIG domain
MTEHLIEHLISDDRFSEPASGNAALQKVLEGRPDVLDSIPSVPAILQSLLAELAQPAENVNLMRVAELIGRDESLAAQCLRMANSALFGRGIPTDSLRGAVRTLGIAHTRDIAISCSMMRIGAAQKILDPVVFWEHSLGCAILSRKLARSVGFDDPEKAYLAGLLHDVGYVVNLVLLPQQTKAALDKGLKTGAFMGESELEAFGFTHCQSGEVLARKWGFSSDLVEVILCHHNPAAAIINPAQVAIVALADRLCRSSNLGMGYAETPDPAASWQEDWKILQEQMPHAARIEWADFTKDADVYFAEIRVLVTAMFHGHT